MNQPRQDRAAPERVVVRTGARLHFGPFSVSGDRGSFGGVGMMIAEPGFEVTVSKSPGNRFEGPAEYRERVDDLVGRLNRLRVTADKGGYDVQLGRVIPRHAGLGSGTQLALALAAATDRLEGRDAGPVEALARSLGRGRRSAIGVHGFRWGGFLVDAGKESAASLGRLQERMDFPQEWLVLLWTPQDVAGLSGDDESSAFRDIPGMPVETTAFLKAAAARMSAAITRRDSTSFSTALWEYGTAVGEYFAPAQGGVFSHPRAREVVDWLRERGVRGVAQSSWGPTLAAVLADECDGERLRAEWPFAREEFEITRGRNEGAEILDEFPRSRVGFP